MISVSIIIPAYNASGFLERCILSVLNQTYPIKEYIVVDDCSTDDTAAIAGRVFQAFDRSDSLVLVRHERNEGLSVARNSGFEKASGDYVYFLDSDDELPDHAIEKLASLIDETSPADVVVGELEVTGAPRSRFGRTGLPEGRIDGNDRIFSSFLISLWPEMACNKLLRRSFLSRNHISFQKGIVHEDALWGFELAMAARSLIISHEITYIYHIQPSSLSQQKKDRNFTSLLVVLSRIVSHIVDRKLYERQPFLWDYLSNFRIYYYKELIRAEMPAPYVREKVLAIREIMGRMPAYPYKRRFVSRLKDLAYGLPVRWGMLYVKILVALSK